MIVVYDLEQFKNYHSCFAIDIKSNEEYFFEVSDFKDDRKSYLSFLSKCRGMIGYNNLAFDYPLLDFFMENHSKYSNAGELARMMFKEAQKIIDSEWGIPEWKIKIPQRDLYKIHHFDNPARRTSLKDLQIAMRWHNVQDLPFKFYHHVALEDREKIKKYNRNDVLSTKAFYEESLGEIKMRAELTKRFNIFCMNWNATKIGEGIFLKEIAKAKNVPEAVLKKQRTHRSEIDFSKCIVDYDIQNDEVKKFRDYVSKIKTSKTKDSVKYKLIYSGMPYEFGTGGIHGCRASKFYTSTDSHIIKTSDVASYYPNIAINFGIYPEHLGPDFVRVYKEIYRLRQIAKQKKIKTDDVGLKLSLNGAYGKSNDQYSFLYDPKYTMTVTISGQIMLTDLAITLQKNGFEIITINTDGLEAIVPANREDEYVEVCADWENRTKFVLEHDSYSKFAVRDVNNYIAQTVDGHIKTKGALEINKDWHKDHSFLIIPKALKEYFINGVNIKDFIYNHKEIYDFCGRLKSDSGYGFYYHYLEGDTEKIETLHRTNRVFISNKGGVIYKRKGNRSERVYAGKKITLFNEYYDSPNYDIDYQWYVTETQKIIDIIEPKQLTLFQ